MNLIKIESSSSPSAIRLQSSVVILHLLCKELLCGFLLCRFKSAQLSSLLQQLSVFLHCSLQSLFSACCLCIVPGRHDLCPLVYFCNICVYCQNTSSLELKSRFIYFSNSQARLSLKWKDLLILGFRLLVRQNK